MSSSLLVSLSAVLVVLLHGRLGVPGLAQLATVGGGERRATSGLRNNLESLIHRATSTTHEPRPGLGSRLWRRDPLRDHRAVVGRDAKTPWYMRVRSVIGLVLLILVLGLALAGAILLFIASGRFLLETLAG